MKSGKQSGGGGGGNKKSVPPKGKSPNVGSNAKVEQMKYGTGAKGEAAPYGCDKTHKKSGQ